MDVARKAAYPYQVLAAKITSEIERGELRAGDRLPSVRTLAQRYDVTTATAQRAIRALVDQGYVQTTQGLGMFVVDTRSEASADEGPVIAAINQQLDRLQATVADLSERLQRLEDDRADE